MKFDRSDYVAIDSRRIIEDGGAVWPDDNEDHDGMYFVPISDVLYELSDDTIWGEAERRGLTIIGEGDGAIHKIMQMIADGDLEDAMYELDAVAGTKLAMTYSVKLRR